MNQLYFQFPKDKNNLIENQNQQEQMQLKLEAFNKYNSKQQQENQKGESESENKNFHLKQKRSREDQVNQEISEQHIYAKEDQYNQGSSKEDYFLNELSQEETQSFKFNLIKKKHQKTQSFSQKPPQENQSGNKNLNPQQNILKDFNENSSSYDQSSFIEQQFQQHDNYEEKLV